MIFISYLVIFMGFINLIRMAIFLIGSDIYNLVHHRLQLHTPNRRTLPRFSVVIPAHNEQSTIIRCITSVMDSSYPKHLLEIVVVDNASTDSTASLVRNLISQTEDSNILLTHCPKRGKAHALNFGIINHTSGEFVMCLDADSYLDSQAIIKSVKYFDDPHTDALAANVKITNGAGILHLTQKFEYLICYQMKRAQTLFNIEYIIGGIGSTFRRSAIEQVGYYDTNTITEDIDITMKLLQLGNRHRRVRYASDVIAYTESVPDVRGLIRQRFRWKYGRSQAFLKNTNMFFSKDSRFTKSLSWFYLPLAIFFDLSFFIEPLLVGFILFVVIYYQDWITFISAISVITLYITFNVFSETTLTTKDKLKLCFFSPFIYFSFYILSFAEYVALIQTLLKLHTLPTSIQSGNSAWTHVNRKPIISS